MDSYKIVLVKLARPDVNNGARALSKLFGLPDAKGYELIELMPFIVLEAPNYAKARKIKEALLVMEKFGFPILISTETGSISKINWPNGVRLNGVPVQNILDSVPEQTNLVNQCPGCGIEIKCLISLQTENKKEPLEPRVGKENKGPLLQANKSSPKQVVHPVKSVKKEESLIEELTDLDETDSDQIVLPSNTGRMRSLDDDMDGLLGEAEEAEVVGETSDSDIIRLAQDESDPELLDELDEVVDDDFLDEDVFTDVGGISGDHIDLQDTARSIETKLALDDEADTDYDEGGDYKLVVGMIRNRQDKALMSKVLAKILEIPESEASEFVNRRGDLLLEDLTLEEAQSYKSLFDAKKLNVKIIN